MKLTIAIFMMALLQVSATSRAQNVSLRVRNASIETVLDELTKQSGFHFLYDVQLISKANKISISVYNAPVKEVLSQCFDNQPFTYVFEGNDVIIKAKPPVLQFAASTITGKVTDDNNQPLPGVTIKIKGSQTAVVTQGDGIYNIKVADKNAVLVFSSIGFASQEVAVGGSTVINVQLKELHIGLNEIVVIGYGSVRKRDLTGAVGTVNMSDFEKAPVKSLDDALGGRVAGVQVVSPDGQPGASSSILIRGQNSLTQANSPLYVIDGFPSEDQNLNSINPADIQSIEVLKDASSTAIYGARGANGVIIITTKKGILGPPVITYEGYYGIQKNLKQMQLMDPYNFVKYQTELNPLYAPGDYFINGRTSVDDYKSLSGINWQDQLFRTAPVQSHNLALRGGNKDTRYSISGSIYDQDGTIINTGFNRYQGRVTLDQTVSKKFTTGIIVNSSYFNSYGSQTSATSVNSLLWNVWSYRPIDGSTDLSSLLNSGQDLGGTSSGDYRFNPILEAQNELRNNITSSLYTNLYGEYAFTPNLKLRVTAGVTRNTLEKDVFNNSKTVYATLPYSQNGVNGSVIFDKSNSYVNENTLTYTKTINADHIITALAGYTIQGSQTSSYGASAILVPNESLGISGLDEGTPLKITSTSSKNNLESFLGRINYSYKSKYLLTATMRADGSSKFNGNNRFGYFPSGAFAWNIDQENFVKKIVPISSAKLRVSYGTTGNNRVSDFAYYSQLTLPYTSYYPFDNTPTTGATASVIGNPGLKWETTAETDLGLDMGLFKDRLTLTADVYKKKTDNLLLNAQVSAVSGFTTAYKNVGSVQNEGLELSLNSVNIRNKYFSWTSAFSISFNRNKVLQLNEGQNSLMTSVSWSKDSGYNNLPMYISQLGQPISMFYGYVWEGNYQYADFNKTSSGTYVLKDNVQTNGSVRSAIQPGDIKYKDLNGDGVVDANDRTIIGNPNPKFVGGFTNNFTYKGFDLNIFIQYSYGNQVLNSNRYIFEGTSIVDFNQYASYENRWTPDNQNNTYYRTGGYGTMAYSSRVIEDGSYVRLKTVALGYGLPSKLTQKLKIKSLRVYVSAQNLVTLTRYSGLDPEVASFSSSPIIQGLDVNGYPRAKTLVFGIKAAL